QREVDRDHLGLRIALFQLRGAAAGAGAHVEHALREQAFAVRGSVVEGEQVEQLAYHFALQGIVLFVAARGAAEVATHLGAVEVELIHRNYPARVAAPARPRRRGRRTARGRRARSARSGRVPAVPTTPSPADAPGGRDGRRSRHSVAAATATARAG